MNRKWPRRAARAVAFFVTVYLLWLGAHSVLGRATPKPLWTKADLPPAPPATENGWSEAHEIRAPEMDAIVRDVLSATDQSNAAFDHARAMDALLNDPKTRPNVDALIRAISKPRFADDCPLKLDARCKMVPWIEAHRLLLFEAHRLFRVEGVEPCATLLTKIVRADIDAAESSRTTVSHMVALSALHEGLTTTLSLARAKPDVKALLEALDLGKLDGRRMVIAEYVLLGRPDLNLVEHRSFTDRLLPYDEGGTAAEIDRRAQASYDAAKRGTSVGMPSIQTATSDPFWWLWNPKGKLMLDLMMLDWPSLIRRVATARGEIETLRKQILAEL